MVNFVSYSLLIMAFMISLLVLIPSWLFVIQEWKYSGRSNGFIANLMLFTMTLVLLFGSVTVLFVFILAFT